MHPPRLEGHAVMKMRCARNRRRKVVAGRWMPRPLFAVGRPAISKLPEERREVVLPFLERDKAQVRHSKGTIGLNLPPLVFDYEQNITPLRTLTLLNAPFRYGTGRRGYDWIAPPAVAITPGTVGSRFVCAQAEVPSLRYGRSQRHQYPA